jgi:hypothetical protein
MKLSSLSSAVLAVGFLFWPPAFAQTTPSGVPQTQKQPTDGGDSPANPRANDASAAAWHKQHTAGVASANKQSAQSYSHPAAPTTGGSTATKSQ